MLLLIKYEVGSDTTDAHMQFLHIVMYAPVKSSRSGHPRAKTKGANW